ncbi:MAG TPA: hypothetical protein VMH81_22945 [Bryobacteraceae bacterium]|nr:hypothetical protein [Bryobacteraceae bacterium]
MRFLLVEIVFPLLVLLFARSVLRSIFRAFRSAYTPPPDRLPRPTVPIGGELKKDPVCGTYVSTIGSVSRKVNGELVYFCSTTCRDKFRAA